jgi:hypothetical protein
MGIPYAAGFFVFNGRRFISLDQALILISCFLLNQWIYWFTGYMPKLETKAYGYGWFIGEVSNGTNDKLKVTSRRSE